MLNRLRHFVGWFRNKLAVAFEANDVQGSTTTEENRAFVVGKELNKGLVTDASRGNLRVFDQRSLDFYKKLGEEEIADSLSVPFVLLDSKSLPRSGLHYMKRTFSKLLEDNFSFCEWYQEPGCCKRMPCKLHGFAEYSKNTKIARLRLLKSHDFKLTDPMYEPSAMVRRVVLLRDPLFMLTSWYALDHLPNYRDALSKSGIHLEKIYMFHEPEVTSAAYKVMDDEFIDPATEHLQDWLDRKSEYILGFLDKWLGTSSQGPYSRVVRYEEINEFVSDLVRELYPFLSDERRSKVVSAKESLLSDFHPRGNPFSCPSARLEEFYQGNKECFELAASKINERVSVLEAVRNF